MNSRAYPDDIKAQAIAALLTGQTPLQVARQFNIPIGTLHSWKSRAKNGDGVAVLASEKKERIGELLVEYLEAGLQTLIIQQVVFRDSTWLSKQSASELAVLHGVIADKQIRLLEALADAPDSADLS